MSENNFAELFNATVLQFATTGDGAGWVGFLPANGVRKVTVECLVKMANAADMTLTLQTADDASGTNATALIQNVPIWKATSGSAPARQTDAKSITETAATGTFIYTFEVPASIIPSTKYLGIVSDAGNAANIYCATAYEDKYYKG